MKKNSILYELIEAARPFTDGNVVDELDATIPLMERLDDAIKMAESLLGNRWNRRGSLGNMKIQELKVGDKFSWYKDSSIVMVKKIEHREFEFHPWDVMLEFESAKETSPLQVTYNTPVFRR